MPSVFTKIINDEIPSFKIAENEDYISFLDVFPLKKGHALVLPKKEIDYIFDLDEELYNGLLSFARRISFAIKAAYPCERIGMAVIGLEVPHAHIHLIPINTMNDMNFSNTKLKLSNAELLESAEKIKRFL
ncbi:MAG: HIT family protein [Bacteroidota bacterium]